MEDEARAAREEGRRKTSEKMDEVKEDTCRGLV